MAPPKTVCKNSEKFSYTGKEMSPMGLGYCADAETVGTQMSGRDGKTWIVGVKNNDKIWMRAPEKPLAPEEPVLTKEEAESDAVKPEEENTEVEPKPQTPEKPKKKTTKKTKKTETPEQSAEEAKTPEEPEGEEAKPKPKRKYTKKSKTTDPASEETETKPEKKERKKRGPSGYNLYIGKIMNELRASSSGLKTTEYMQQAQAMWKSLSKMEQTKVGEELKEAYLAAHPQEVEATA